MLFRVGPVVTRHTHCLEVWDGILQRNEHEYVEMGWYSVTKCDYFHIYDYLIFPANLKILSKLLSFIIQKAVIKYFLNIFTKSHIYQNMQLHDIWKEAVNILSSKIKTGNFTFLQIWLFRVMSQDPWRGLARLAGNCAGAGITKCQEK